MSKKFPQRYLKPTVFDCKNSIFEGIVWPMPGSNGNEYSVECTPKGFTCDCAGFTFRGACKHSKQVVKQIEAAIEGRYPRYSTA